MKISYNEATALGCSTLEKDLELCEKAGFDFIEIRYDMLVEYLKTHTPLDLKNFFDKSHLKPHAFNAMYTYPELFSEKDDPAKQDAFMQQFLLGCAVGQVIDNHHTIVVPPLQRDPNGGPFIGTEEETFQNCVRILTKLSDIAKIYGMKLCFEPVGFERSSVRHLELADKIVRTVNRDNVGYVLDSYNLYLNNGLNDFGIISILQPEKIFAVHINNADDVPAHERGQDKRRLCDSGVVNLENYLKNIKATGYDGMISIETFRPEYWQMPAEELIQAAYITTKKCVESI